MGCVGMCLNDFCRLTPLEFTAVFEAWQQKETYAERRQWEQSRFLACSILKPYSKKGLELMPVLLGCTACKGSGGRAQYTGKV